MFARDSNWGLSGTDQVVSASLPRCILIFIVLRVALRLEDMRDAQLLVTTCRVYQLALSHFSCFLPEPRQRPSRSRKRAN